MTAPKYLHSEEFLQNVTVQLVTLKLWSCLWLSMCCATRAVKLATEDVHVWSCLVFKEILNNLCWLSSLLSLCLYSYFTLLISWNSTAKFYLILKLNQNPNNKKNPKPSPAAFLVILPLLPLLAISVACSVYEF